MTARPAFARSALARCAAGALLTAVQGGAAQSATILDEVLAQLSSLYAGPLVSMFGNAALNAPPLISAQTTLAGGQSVIIGYDNAAQPVRVMATDAGILVTPEQAATLRSGLAAGLYPAGSALYSLPPAGQLSLFDQNAEGQALGHAQSLLMARIDGRVTNVVTGMLFPDLAPTVLASAYNPEGINPLADGMMMSSISSTVLGAVNTGTVVSTIGVTVGALPDRLDALGMSKVSLGANSVAGLAATETAMAVSAGKQQLGGSTGLGNISYNIATNAMDIDGRVTQNIAGATYRVRQITSTVLGAVNGGSIDLGTPPALD